MNSLRLNFQEGDLPSLHPHVVMVHLRGICTIKSLYEGLTRLDNKGKAQLAGAESAERSSDGLLYTFKLKENKWSDGSPVTAHHYANAWREALSPTSNCSRADMLYMFKNGEQIKKGELPPSELGVKALDDRTLVIELAYPSPYLYELLAQGICAPLADVKEKEPTRFNGPFMVDEWKRGDHLRLKRNPHYWAAKNIPLDHIDIYMVQDIMTAYSMFEKGQIDWVGVPFIPLPPEIIESLKENNSLRSHQVDRAFWVYMNTKEKHLSSPLIRQALSQAVDRKAVSKHILVANYPLEKPIPETLQPNNPSNLTKYNVEEAKAKFKKGMQELGYTEKTFPVIEISYSQQANRKQLAEYLQQVWSKTFGIQVKTVPQEWNVLRSNLEKGQFQISGGYDGAFFNDPLEMLDRFLVSGPRNFSQWTDENYSSKLRKARGEANLEKRMQTLRDAEYILLEQMTFFPLTSDEFMFAHHPDVTGYTFDGVGGCDFSHISKMPHYADALEGRSEKKKSWEKS